MNTRRKSPFSKYLKKTLWFLQFIDWLIRNRIKKKKLINCLQFQPIQKKTKKMKTHFTHFINCYKRLGKGLTPLSTNACISKKIKNLQSKSLSTVMTNLSRIQKNNLKSTKTYRIQILLGLNNFSMMK